MKVVRWVLRIRIRGGHYLIDKLADKMAIIMFVNSEINKYVTIEKLSIGLKILLNSFLIIFIISFLVKFSIIPNTVFISMQAFAILRVFTGGHHIKSNDLCVIISCLMFLLISLATPEINEVSFFVISVLSVILILIFAPSNIPSYARIFVKYSKTIKVVALLSIICNLLLIHSYVIGVAFFIQSLTLITKKRGFINE